MVISKNKVSIIAALTIVGLASAGCGKKKSKDDAFTVDSIDDMKLSTSLKLTIPSGLSKAAGQSTSLALSGDGPLNLTGKRSSEACRTIQQADMLFGNLASIGNMMCHLEAESKQLQFGVKYLVKLKEANGTMEMPLWIDNSTAGTLTMYTCKSGSIAEKIVISGASSAGPKGSINFRGSESGMTFASNLDFDFSTSGVKILKGQNTFSQNSDAYASDTNIEIKEPGVSLVKMSNRGSAAAWGTFEDRGAVRFNGTLGQAIFKGSGSGGTNVYNWSTRNTFDANGLTVANATATADIKVEATDLPAALASGYAVTAASGWDCSTEKTIEVDMVNGSTATAHAKCENNHSSNFDCFGADFEQGSSETIQ